MKVMMKVGDLVRFTDSGHTGVVLEFTRFGGVSILITGDVKFTNPTCIGIKTVHRTAEVISNAQRDSQSSSR
jgi:hypothetical protein